jgi:hypothetical protein
MPAWPKRVDAGPRLYGPGRYPTILVILISWRRQRWIFSLAIPNNRVIFSRISGRSKYRFEPAHQAALQHVLPPDNGTCCPEMFNCGGILVEGPISNKRYQSRIHDDGSRCSRGDEDGLHGRGRQMQASWQPTMLSTGAVTFHRAPSSERHPRYRACATRDASCEGRAVVAAGAARP